MYISCDNEFERELRKLNDAMIAAIDKHDFVTLADTSLRWKRMYNHIHTINKLATMTVEEVLNG